MEAKPAWLELAERTNNFHGEHKSFIKNAHEYESFFSELDWIRKTILVDLDKHYWLDREQTLKMVFKRVYNFVIMQNPKYEIFGSDWPYYDDTDDIFEACMFTALCMFIHHSKKIKGIRDKNFLYKYSSYEYTKKGTPWYFDFDYPEKDSVGFETFTREAQSFRKMRERLFENRAVKIERIEWSATASSSEHEWSFYYVLSNLDEDLADTYKRIGNLYNGVSAALKFADDGYFEKLDKAYKSFTNKLKKIKYEKFLELQHEILAHICENETHYGINIYRFEKLLRFWNIGYEMTRLLDCKCAADEESRVLETSVRLNNVWFPSVYKKFASIESYDEMGVYALLFGRLMNQVVGASRLILDEFVEEGIFGTDGEWETLFLDTINQMTEKVFYNPREISSDLGFESPEAQEAFQRVLDAHVNHAIRQTHI